MTVHFHRFDMAIFADSCTAIRNYYFICHRILAKKCMSLQCKTHTHTQMHKYSVHSATHALIVPRAHTIHSTIHTPYILLDFA